MMSSARGLLGHPAGYTAYCASKAAVDGITKALGCELGPTGITVNAIAPTVFRSPLTAWMFGDDDNAKTVRSGFLARVPKGRLGEPEDLAGPLLFLASRVGTVVPKREILAEVWRQPYGGADKTVDVHVSWLRRKLGESAAEPRFLHTVRGVGIKLVDPDA